MSPSIISEDLYSDLPRIEDCSPPPSLSLSLSHTHTHTHARTQARARARTDARTQARTHARTCAHVIVIFHKFTLTRMSSTRISALIYRISKIARPNPAPPPTPTPLPPPPPPAHTHTHSIVISLITPIRDLTGQFGVCAQQWKSGLLYNAYATCVDPY